MTTKKARDFLDKELFVKRSLVTFRLLSRELGIHVNDAKNELQHYYDAVRATDTPAVPTYLVSGEVPALTVRSRLETDQLDSGMDLDPEFEEDQEEVDVVHQSKMLLVDARMLDETKAQFSRIHAVHIYSLSPARLGDAGLVCTPSSQVHHADVKGGPELFSIVGKITGPHVKLKASVTRTHAASSSKITLDAPAKAALKARPSIKTEQQTTKGKSILSDVKEGTSAAIPLKSEPKDKPKLSGKLDWSKAKTKEKEPVAEKIKEEKKATVVPNDTLAGKKAGSRVAKPPVSKSGDAQKRGQKRKPRTDTELESASEQSSVRAKPSATGSLSTKKVLVSSDEDEDSDTQVRRLGQRRLQRKSTVTSDSEMSLRVMMDIDDEQVDRVSRVSRNRPQPEEEEESSEPEKEATAPPVTSEGEESDEVPVVRKQRKPRKVVPVGANGLKKRRVVKRRTTTDAKGYMQTEDYTSYESVEEEEVEVKSKGKGKATKKASEPKVEIKVEVEVEETKPKVVSKEASVGRLKVRPPPRAKGGAPKRGGLLNFFGPEKGKK